MAQSNIKELREQRGLTQSELARRAGVTRQAVSLWEKGKGGPVSSANLFKVAEVLGVDPKQIMSGGGLASSDALTAEERRLLGQFRALSQRERVAVLAVIAALLGQG